MTSSLSIGFIPGGTGNGLVASVLKMSDEHFSVESSAFVVAKGRTMRMDLTEIEAEYQKEKIYSFLAVFWAVLADCDINSEVLRWMGQPRFTVWGVYRTLFKRNYQGSLFYTGAPLKVKADADTLDD